MTHTTPEHKDIYLFGFPIAHSGAPSLHNLVFESVGSPSTYKLWSTSAVNQAVLDELRSPSSGGAAWVPPPPPFHPALLTAG
jgi:shikimate 5-dehydrogenase